MRRLAISSGDAFILVYSVDDPKSFDELEQLRQTILDERERAYNEASGQLIGPIVDCSPGSQVQAPEATINESNTNPDPLRPIQRDQRTSSLTPARHWSLANIFQHNQPHPAAPCCHHQNHSMANTTQNRQSNSLHSSVGSINSGSNSNSNSTDHSRRSSISAAEAALKTRRTRHPPMVIVANKYDLPEEKHRVNSDEIEALVEIDWNNGFVRASAALNLNIDDIFQQVLKQARQPPTLTAAIVSKRRKSLPPKLPQ